MLPLHFHAQRENNKREAEKEGKLNRKFILGKIFAFLFARSLLISIRVQSIIGRKFFNASNHQSTSGIIFSLILNTNGSYKNSFQLRKNRLFLLDLFLLFFCFIFFSRSRNFCFSFRIYLLKCSR